MSRVSTPDLPMSTEDWRALESLLAQTSSDVPRHPAKVCNRLRSCSSGSLVAAEAIETMLTKGWTPEQLLDWVSKQDGKTDEDIFQPGPRNATNDDGKTASEEMWTATKWMSSQTLDSESASAAQKSLRKILEKFEKSSKNLGNSGPSKMAALLSAAVKGASALDILTAGFRAHQDMESKVSSELEAFRALASKSEDEIDKRVQEHLEASLPVLKELFKAGLRKLAKAPIATPKEFSDKYSGETFELSYGSLNMFFGGLELMVGRPKVPVLLAMWEEHSSMADSTLSFVTSNYGVRTCSRDEFAFALGGNEAMALLKTNGKFDFKDAEGFVRDFLKIGEEEDLLEKRAMTPAVASMWSSLEQHLKSMFKKCREHQCRAEAGKSSVEENRTTPSKLENTSWLSMRKSLEAMDPESRRAGSIDVPAAFQALSKFAEAHDRQVRSSFSVEKTTSFGALEDPAKLKDPSYARLPLPLKHYQREFLVINLLLLMMDEPPLTLEEFIGIRLYTGPLFSKYNSVLRYFTGAPAMVQHWQDTCMGNKYTCTVHVVNSCLIKLSKLQPAVKVYRGMAGGRLPKSFVEANEFNVKGGIEFGFMSTTTNWEVATSYAGSGTGGIVFEIQLGMLDRGASLGWASQYPHEDEICFGPLAGLQVVDVRVDDNILVVEVRLTVNLISLTIEQVIGKRRTIIEDMCLNLSQEARLSLTALSSKLQPNFVDFLESTKEKVSEAFRKISKEEGDWYNNDEIFRACTNNAISLREAVGHLDSVLQKHHLERPEQVYQKLLALNLVSAQKISDVIDSTGETSLPNKLTIEELAPCEEATVIFDELGQDVAAASEIAKMRHKLEGFEETLRQSIETGKVEEDQVVRALPAILEIVKASRVVMVAFQRLPVWQEASQEYSGLIGSQLLKSTSFSARRACFDALTQLAALDRKVFGPVGVEALASIVEKETSDYHRRTAATILRDLGFEIIGLTGANSLLRMAEKDGSPQLRLEGLSLVGDLGPEAFKTIGVDTLFDIAKLDKHAEVRESCIGLLASLGPEVIESTGVQMILCLAEQDKEWSVRKRAAAASAELGAEAIGSVGVDILVRAVREDSNLGVRAAAAGTLGKLGAEAVGSEAVLAVTRRADEDQSEEVRRSLAAALGSFGVEAIGAHGVEVLMDLAEKDSALQVRLDAIAVIGKLGPKVTSVSSPSRLVRVAELDSSESARLAAIAAMSSLGAEGIGDVGVKVLLRIAVRDANKWVRRAGIAALVGLGAEGIGPAGVAELVRIAEQDGEWQPRRSAVSGLANFGAQAVGEANIQVILRLLQKDSNREIRLAAAQALANFGFEVKGIDVLEQVATSDSDPDVRRVVGGAYAKLRVEAIRKGGVSSLLEAAEQDDHASVRQQALRVLGQLGTKAMGEECVGVLLKVAEEDAGERVKITACGALCKLGVQVQKHLSKLLESLRKPVESRNFGDWEVQRAAVEGLGALSAEALRASQCETLGGIEDVTWACEVSSSSASSTCREALHGVKQYWESDGYYDHWLQLALPAGMTLTSLNLLVKDFGERSPSCVRIWQGSKVVKTLELEQRDYEVTLLGEADLKNSSKTKSEEGSSSSPTNRPPCFAPSDNFLCIEVIGHRSVDCRIGGLQVFAAWGRRPSNQ